MTPNFPYIKSLLDNDFYKFTMQQGVIKLFPRSMARYEFINRGKHIFPAGFADLLRKAIDNLVNLSLSLEEKDYLAETCPYLEPTYLDFLQGYTYNPAEVIIEQNGNDLSVKIEGYWYRTILWEVPIMALISELFYYTNDSEAATSEEIISINKEKIEKYAKLGVTIADFGTRRRHSYLVHRMVIQALEEYGSGTFVGTSNVHFAMRYNTKPIGTHAHEWFMFHAAKYGFKMSNSLGLEHWTAVYRGDLGIALTDTYTTDIFFEQFDKKFSKLFDGVRHDSGDAIEFAEKTISHYKKMGIDPLSKTIIFSDALNYDKVERIANFCKGKIGMSFGIGTDFTNDVGLVPLNIVIKMTAALPENQSWIPVVKLSDEKGKYTGDPKMISLSKEILGID
ncbi:nicotinate phosphoribosyltransferase [Arcticibacter eurypsychrophilus]|uniref:nicotinate phosphoribosyltransferase n=1 Tax=Arcticibacter eurypsychrophilus TaxID=1434752 RepID=UPI00084D3814|nr:nicotinate phosphoribosyltransferase [Arcticibacter eurypsychrophilus]